ncbi:MAG: hypothetical protein XD91_1365 [Clostridiales bacterium 38_11]|nr:MAG: hypothetical protein XD91_1365 [Clostridiales bacterium 38_11]HBH13404.1 hypothetical protein [Clostridiales bacterium]
MKRRFLTLVLLLSVVQMLSSCTFNGNKTTDIEDPIETTVIEEPTTPTEPELSEEEKARIALEKALKEREALELIRREELGEFYVPLPAIGEEGEAIRFSAKGLFVTGSTAGKPVDREKVQIYIDYIDALKNNETATINRLSSQLSDLNTLEKIIAIAAATEINAVVIDVKDDSGLLTYESSIELVKEVEADRYPRIYDVKELMAILEEYDIYPIARIVTFKDKNFAYAMPEHSIQLSSGGVWHDYSGTPWVNPFDKYIWDYNIAIAQEAALMGFKEIQFDYVRFPDNAVAYNAITTFPGRDGKAKDVAIGEFLEYSQEILKEYNVTTAADVFGLITRTWADKPEDIGQTWLEISPHTDAICPMVYPSHYGANWYGFEVPDAHPYGVVRGSMMEAIEKNGAITNPADIRPWLQDFTATWVQGYIYYGYNEVRQQIIAAKELGIDGYMIWNPSNVYDPRAYLPSEKEKTTSYPLDTGEKDLMGRTPSEAMLLYFRSERNGIYSKMFLLTPLAERSDDFDEFYSQMTSDNLELIDYDVNSHTMVSESEALVSVNYKYRNTENDEPSFIASIDTPWRVIKEKGVWKIVRENGQ